MLSSNTGPFPQYPSVFQRTVASPQNLVGGLIFFLAGPLMLILGIVLCVVYHSIGFIGLIVAGTVFCLVGTLLFVQLGKSAVIYMNAQSSKMVLSVRHVPPFRVCCRGGEAEYDLKQVARFRHTKSYYKGRKRYRLVMVTTDGKTVPILNVFGPKFGHLKQALNTWLRHHHEKNNPEVLMAMQAKAHGATAATMQMQAQMAVQMQQQQAQIAMLQSQLQQQTHQPQGYAPGQVILPQMQVPMQQPMAMGGAAMPAMQPVHMMPAQQPATAMPMAGYGPTGVAMTPPPPPPPPPPGTDSQFVMPAVPVYTPQPYDPSLKSEPSL